MFVNILNDTPTSLCMFVQLVHVYISIDISLTRVFAIARRAQLIINP
jgi:hypothetical protein